MAQNPQKIRSQRKRWPLHGIEPAKGKITEKRMAYSDFNKVVQKLLLLFTGVSYKRTDLGVYSLVTRSM